MGCFSGSKSSSNALRRPAWISRPIIQVGNCAIPQPCIDLLNTYGDKISSSDKKSKQLDWSDNLVGNVKQEHKIEDHIWQEKPNENLPSLFNWMGACVNLYVKTKLQQGDEQDSAVAEKGIKKVALHNSWLVNSIAGDFNPPHMHYGMLSTAGWLKMPESVEKNKLLIIIKST